MWIRVVRYFEDNFSYIIRASRDAAAPILAVVDPGDTELLLKELGNSRVERVLLTHKHKDHTGELPEFVQALRNLPANQGHNVEVWAGNEEKLSSTTKPWCSQASEEQTEFSGLKLRVFHSPCHTRGHVLFYFESAQPTAEEHLFDGGDHIDEVFVNRALFTGDTIFIGGCGRFFEGTPSEMYKNIAWVKSLPDSTHVFCGHDYVTSNIKFALGIEPENTNYLTFLTKLQNQAVLGTHMLPSSVGQEKLSNVFFRSGILAPKFGVTDPVECLGLIRQYKDQGKSLQKL